MNANVVNVAVVDGKTITQTVELSSVKNGQPVRIKAVQGGKYILAEGANGIAPENITIKRVGKDLHIALEGSDPDQPQLIIEDFEGTGGQLVGVAEDGSYHEYISSDAEQDRSAAFLIEGVEAPQVLGAQPLSGFGDGLAAAAGIGWFWPALLGLAALGVLGGIYAATRDDDGGNDDAPGAGGGNADKGSIGGVDDNVGDKQGLIENGGSTDDRTPTFTGEGKPGTSVEIVDNGETIGTAIVGEDGKWEYTPPEPGLDDGKHDIVIVPVDENGKKGEPSPEYEIIVDTVAPSRPLIDGIYDDVAPQEGQIGSGGHTNDTTPTLSGTGEAESIIHIYDNGVEIGSVQADGEGKWSFTPDPELVEGPHEFTVVAEDAAGNTSTPSLPFPIIVDLTPPGKPGAGTGGIDDALDNVGADQGSIGNGDSTDDTTPTLIGSGGEPGDIVTIIDNGLEIGTAIVDEDGKWEFTPDPELTEGPHEIVVVITDPAGNESEPSDPHLIIVDTTAPSKPGPGTGGIDDVQDNVGPNQGSIGDGDITDDNTPSIIGSGGEPGDIVTIIDNGLEIGTAIVDEDGKWEFTPDPELTEGPHEIVVVITDPAGNESEPSDPYTIIVDTTAPSKPGPGTGGIDDVQDNVGPNQGSIGDGDITDDNTPSIIGSGGEPGDIVTIIDNGLEIGTAIVDEDGKWEFTPDPELTEGPHEIVVVITDPAGNESEPSDPYTIIVDITAPIAPTLTSVVDDQGAVTGNLTSGDTTDDARPDLSGTAEDGSLVTIYDNGRPIGSVIATGGTWTFTPTVPLSNGPHTITATSTDAAGNVSPPTLGFDLDVAAGGVPPAPAIITVVDDQGAFQGPLAQNDFTDDAQPTINGTGVDGTIITVFANGLPLGTTTVVGGQWSFTPPGPLDEGLNNLSAQATDAAGNPSPSTGDYPINVDTSAPSAPTGQSLTDDVGAITGPIVAGDTTDDANPTFSGMAEAGALVVIYDNGLAIGSTSADPVTGAWSFTPAAPLVNGPHSFAAQAIDSAGNTGPMGPAIPFNVDTSSVVISITSVVDNEGTITGNLTSGQTTDDTTPTLNGQATPGGIVSIYDGTTLLGTVMADATTGQWSFTTPALFAGPHDLTATVTTLAGGESAPTPVFDVNIDTVAPLAPLIGDVADDVGAIQGTVADGGSTDDTTPTLSGSGLQPGDVVMIYDNGDLIGSTSVIADGSWSYTPTTPLNPGPHPFTVVAVDPAGNESAPSASWSIEIDTAAPIATAVVESMGKDSGADSGDFVTNDGSAGRLIQGSLTAALGAGEKVQVSTDGGTTWLDVLMNADGTWSFIDQSSHSNDWSIQTRVMDTAGNSNATSQAVILDAMAPDAPTEISVFIDSVRVEFDGAQMSVGDSINLAIGDHRIEYKLTADDILAGVVQVGVPSQLQPIDPSSVMAAMVSSSGNISDYLAVNFGHEDFSSFPNNTSLNPGVPFDINGLKVTHSVTTDAGGRAEALISDRWSHIGGAGRSLTIGSTTIIQNYSGHVELELPVPSTSFGMSLHLNSSTSSISFFDVNGVLIETVPLPRFSGLEEFNYVAPPGKEIALVDINIVSEINGIMLDNINWDNSFVSVPVPTEQTVEDMSHSYYGSSEDNIFFVSDVGVLEGDGIGIHAEGGMDTLSLTGSNQNLDLTTLIDKISSIEIIDITGTGNNTLNLSLGDVLEQGETSLFTADDTVQMMVKGNAGDVVNLDDLLPDGTDPGDWATAGTATVAGVTYNVFQHSTLDAQLLIQDGVTTNLV